MFRVVEGEI